MNRCAAPGCGRFSRTGRSYCSRHQPSDDPQRDDDGANLGDAGAAAFRARLATGDYETVVGPELRRVLQGALVAPDLEEELGAVRVSLARLIHEERDPSRLAAGVARLTSVAVQAARLRQSGNAEADTITAILEKTLAEIEAEAARGDPGENPAA